MSASTSKPVASLPSSVSDGDDVDPLVVVFEEDHIWEAMDVNLPIRSARTPGRLSLCTLDEAVESTVDFRDELLAKSGSRSEYQFAAARSSSCADAFRTRRLTWIGVRSAADHERESSPRAQMDWQQPIVRDYPA
jgi:hypothetical protein